MVDQRAKICLLRQCESAILYQLQQQLAVVDHLQFKSVLPVIIFEGSQTVRALDDHLFDGSFPEDGRILLGQFVKYILIAQTAQ